MNALQSIISAMSISNASMMTLTSRSSKHSMQRIGQYEESFVQRKRAERKRNRRIAKSSRQRNNRVRAGIRQNHKVA